MAEGRDHLEQISSGARANTARELQKGQEALHDIKSHVQSQLGHLKSPAFCKTSNNREYLDRLWLAATLDKDEAALQSGIQDAQAVYERYMSKAAVLEAEREQRGREMINGLVTVVGITGLADFFALLNNGLHVSDFGPIAFEVGAIAILAILVFVCTLWKGWRGHGTRDRRRRAGLRQRHRR